MQADIQTLYRSPISSVHNFLCRCEACTLSGREHQNHFAIVYIRTGNFRFKVFRNDLDAYHGFFLINKPGYEYRVGHVHEMPDQCTIFSIPAASLALLQAQTASFSWFFNNPDIQSVLIKATPETEYLHHCIFRTLHQHRFSRLPLESRITTLFTRVLASYTDPATAKPLNDRQKKNYLPAVETVKQFISENFTEDISLSQLAALGCISPFHFNRLFKQVTAVTPYQYLLRVRLQQAHLELCDTRRPVTAIAFSTGFNSLEHFSAAYKKLYGQAPSAVRS